MFIKRFLEGWKNLETKLVFMRFVIIVMCLTILVMSGFLYKMADSQRTIVVPSHLKSKVRVSNDYASPSYVRVMTSYLMGLLYDYTPYNINKRYTEFLYYVPVESYKEVKSKLDTRIAEIERTHVSEDLKIEKFKIAKDGLALIQGKVTRYASGQTIGNEEIRLKVRYQINHGGFQIVGFKSLSDREYQRFVNNHGLQS